MHSNEKITSFINSVCEKIKHKPIHESISIEIENHIVESSEILKEKGASEQQAVEQAIEQMGNPQDMGKALNKIHRPKIEWKIMLLVLTLLGFGLFTLSTIKSSRIPMEVVLQNQMGLMAFSIVLSIIIFFFDYRKLEKYCLYTFISGFIPIISAYLMGYTVNGKYYIFLGGMEFSPDYISLLLYSISFVGLLNQYKIENKKNILILLGLTAASIISMLEYPSVVLSIVLSIIYLTLTIIKISSREFKGNKKKYLRIITSVFVGIILLFGFVTAKTSYYRVNRVISFFNPYQDAIGSGWMPIQLKNARENSGLFGKDEELMEQYSNELPSMESDYIFTYIIANFGWITALFIIALIISVSMIMIKDSTKIKDSYGKNLITAVGILFIIQSLLNIFMNLGLMPITAIGLPFIAYGSSSLIVNMILIGIILSVYRRKDIIVVQNKVEQL